ncbi:MAG TPA: hypothetical protein VEC99_12615, partial [Clostridia bacterium]|nr:hypothetical protein [Clostridia bacterium]
MRRIVTLLFLSLALVGLFYLTATTRTPNRLSRPTLNSSLQPPASDTATQLLAETNRSLTASGSAVHPPLAAVSASALSSNTAPTTGQSLVEGKISEKALRQILSLEEAKAGRSAVQNKIDSQLLFAGKISRNEPVADGVSTLQVELDRDQAGRVLLDIKANVTKDLLAEIEKRGGKVVNSFAEYQAIRAALPLERIEDLAQRSDVLFVGPAVRAECHAGSVNSEGDIAQKAASARTSFQVNGTGVKVGVLSDSVDHLSQSQTSGDLGTVTVLQGQSGVPASGEGTAMLEIVHDIAPGAALYYATAFGGVAAFANNIRQLKAAGCDIIIDDVLYFNESPFQDGPIAQAVNEVTASGALFFSSAGNSGNKNDGQSGVWEGDFVDGGQVVAPLTGQGRVHSFGSANFNTLTSGGGSRRVDLFWADPIGRAGNDYDVYVLDATGEKVVAASDNTQNGSQDPYEAISKVELGQRVVVVRYSGESRYLHLGTGRGRLAISTGGQTRGHNSAENAFCVAAVSAANATTPFTTGAKVETFSSDGLRRVFYRADGSPITPGNFS